MQIIKFPEREDWPDLCRRGTRSLADLQPKVVEIMQAVQSRGDAALKEFTKKFDGVDLEQVVVSVPKDFHLEDEFLAESINLAIQNIRTFHEANISALEGPVIETQPGIKCWSRTVAIDQVGIYVPGGQAILFSTLMMLVIPAQISGCKEIVVCTPPNKEGDIADQVMYTASALGIEKIYKVGGAQAIAAMAYGTESVPKVDKIFGPGNQYVNCAKNLLPIVAEGVSYDIPAGPTELLVIADHTAKAEYVVADLLSQAEHGPDSQVILATTDAALAEQVEQSLSAYEYPALTNSRIIYFKNTEDAVAFANLYAAEHLIIATENCTDLEQQVTSAGSVFLGNFSPESAGDYISGTNHTLPTSAAARFTGGVNVKSYQKTFTVQELSEAGIKSVALAIESLALAEGLPEHAKAATVRMKDVS